MHKLNDEHKTLAEALVEKINRHSQAGEALNKSVDALVKMLVGLYGASEDSKLSLIDGEFYLTENTAKDSYSEDVDKE